MPFVLDASITVTWAFRDEDHPLANLALTRLRGDSGLVPVLWWFEVRNVLVINERRDRLTRKESDVFLNDLLRFPITIDASPEEKIIELARTHRLTVYDAAYLELAVREGVPLATLDSALARAARAEGVELLGVTAT